MNRAIFWRLIWKEYRLQRAFWIAMAVLAVMVMLFIRAFAPNLYDRIYPLFCIAFGAPVFYALGCASTTFAGEHDAGTYEFQRSLPVTASRLFWGKIALVFLSTLAMVVPLLFLAFLLSGWKLHIPGADRSWDIEISSMAGFAGTVAWLYIVWGVFFSLILKRPLLAVVLCATIASIGPYLIAGILTLLFPSQSINTLEVPIVIFVGISILLAVLDVLLGRQWLREFVHPIKRLRQLIKSAAVDRPDSLADYLSRPNSWSMLWRLSWQHWRQSTWVGNVVLTTFAILAVVDILVWWGLQKYGPVILNIDRNIYFEHAAFAVNFTLILIPLLCSFTFLGDQRKGNFRYFAERGIGPRLVWLSRLWPWLLIVTVWFALYAIFFTAYLWDWQNPSIPLTQRYFFSIPWYLLVYLILSVCVGQFCSMFFRSGIPAGVFSLVITAILTGWAALMLIWGINWLWSVVPISLVLLLATWLRAPDWVLERNGPRTWLRPGLVVAVPAIIILTAVPLYRVYQIPVVDPGFSVEEFNSPLTPEERATRNLLIKASEKIRPLPQSENEKATYNPAEDNIGEEEKIPVYTDSTARAPLTAEEIALVELNREVIPLLIEASKGSERIYSDAHGGKDDHFCRRSELNALLVHSAMMLESDGRFDEALEQYLAVIRISKQLRSTVEYNRYGDYLERQVYEQLPFWATRSGQTAERIKNAVGQLEKLTADVPANDVEIKVDYIRFREALSTGRNYSYSHYQYVILWAHFPWERARALRLINMMTREDLDVIHKAESNARNGERIDVLPYMPAYAADTPGIVLTSGESLDLYYFRCMRSSWRVIRQYAEMENRRRATRIVLALQAWKLEHGGYPKTLDELVGPYFKELPKDPYRAEPYQYYPEGLKAWIPAPGMNFELLSSGMDKPFIWSTSPEIQIRPNKTEFLNRYYVNDMGKSSGYIRYEDGLQDPTSLYDILSHGRCFFLP